MFGPDFYPTPLGVSLKMLAKIPSKARYILEPSAGKGDLAEAIRGNARYDNRKVDTIEANPELAQVLASKGFPVVGHDWLSYDGVSYYDAIVMNPPFSEGARHLLRAWDFLHGGDIVCLLNRETIDNPYSAERKRLADVIKDHGSVEYLGDCFSSAIRKTGVDVAMVHLVKVGEDDDADLWASDSQEREADEFIGPEEAALAIRDELGNMEHFYNAANDHMLKAFAHLRKAASYLHANGVSTGSDYREIVGLALDNRSAARAEFSIRHRRDAWKRVFDKLQFHRWLDKKQREAFIRDIETNSNVPFTAQNIKGTLQNVIAQRKRLFEQSVANVFDELTKFYKGNTNHTEGWKTNSDYMVNEKLVFPYGCSFDPSPWRRFSLRWTGSTIDIYSDLDRILCVLAGEIFDNCRTIRTALDEAFSKLGGGVKAPFNNTCESRFFNIKFFMKGTVHLEWRDRELWGKFNQAAAAGKAWLGRGQAA